MARAMGREVEVVSVDDAISRFNELIESEPKVTDDVDRELREALGLRSGVG